MGKDKNNKNNKSQKIIREQMTFYRSFYESAKKLEPEMFKSIMIMIFEYGLNGNIIYQDDETKTVENMMFTLIRPVIDKNNTNYLNALERKNKSKSETEANSERINSELIANNNRNENEIITNESETEANDNRTSSAVFLKNNEIGIMNNEKGIKNKSLKNNSLSHSKNITNVKQITLDQVKDLYGESVVNECKESHPNLKAPYQVLKQIIREHNRPPKVTEAVIEIFFDDIKSKYPKRKTNESEAKEAYKQRIHTVDDLYIMANAVRSYVKEYEADHNTNRYMKSLCNLISQDIEAYLPTENY